MKNTTTKKAPVATNAASTCKHIYPNLSLYCYDDSLPNTFSYIPEVRSGIRLQLKLLRSVSNSVVLLGIFCEFLLCLCIKPSQEFFGDFTGLLCCLLGLAIALIALFLAFCIRSATWEIRDELKKLNEEI